MGRRYGISLALMALGFVFAPLVASAGVPDPALSTIPNVVGSPDGLMPYKVTIVGSSGPIDSANVTLVWSTPGDTSTCWCPTQTHPSVQAATNASGIATFNLRLGSCLNPATIPGGVAVSVFVNAVKIKEVGQVSPDVITGHSPPCVAGLADAVDYTADLSNNVYHFCHDLNSDNAVGLVDAVLLTPPVTTNAHCP